MIPFLRHGYHFSPSQVLGESLASLRPIRVDVHVNLGLLITTSGIQWMQWMQVMTVEDPAAVVGGVRTAFTKVGFKSLAQRVSRETL